MTEADGESALLEAVGDVPVVVRVEIGEARMAAREWASLGRGDVIDARPAHGRAGPAAGRGVPVARGELVNVDGEVGVRIAERLARRRDERMRRALVWQLPRSARMLRARERVRYRRGGRVLEGLTAGGPSSPSERGAASPAREPVAPAQPPSSAAPDGTREWKGTYKSTPGTIVLPKDVKWKVRETTAGVGEGTLALAVDRATGPRPREVDGVLGPATVDGVAATARLRRRSSRQDPPTTASPGTLSGDLGDAATPGTMNVALADVSAVRNATFELLPAR